MITALDIEKVITDKGPMSNIKGPLISSQRYLDKAKVNDRAAR
ncbi:chromosome partitioning protein ParB, partial [Salmonella enterica subsp. salamae]|nr:chromosome partitioning protein ParB [Salmonella enterica subsp. salamae serovar Sofia]